MATSINPTAPLPQQFFPLPSRQRVTSNRQNAEVAAPFNFADFLPNSNISSTEDTTGLGVTDILDLSPEAQNFLDFFDNAQAAIFADDSIILTDAQQAQIDAIITPFKDAPFSTDTYQRILEELRAANLAPEQLAIQQTATEPFSLTQFFLNAFEEEQPTTFPSLSNNANQDTQALYTQQIFKEWERISTRFTPFAIANFVENPDARRRRNE